ncbi:MAG: Flp pilus assembly complex ATPase component TadA [Myxococcales bacterium]|nr:Flp pilus assembly complex ATPase component TadA [Myxococcales bacterium]
MSKLDVYLRSIEKFGAAGAVLTSGQAVTLRFPDGDRNATQVTPHDLLIGMVREVAPPAALQQVDSNRPARFDVDSEGRRYTLTIQPRPGIWQVVIEPAAAAAPPSRPTPVPRAATAPSAGGGGGGGDDMRIERGQYDSGPVAATPAVTTPSGSGFLDGLTQQARASRATDLYLAVGSPPTARAGGQLVVLGDRQLDGELLSRELGVVAPAEARGAWAEHGAATFAYGDGAGRVRVTLGRDARGPRASLRLLHAEGPPLDRLGLGAAAAWLDARGLIVVSGAAGAGKTTTLAALVRALADRRRFVISIEDPIEITHAAPSVSQRAVGEHVASFAAGVAAAMREGADAIVVGAVANADAAAAVIDAVAGGHLVLTTVPSIAHLLDRLPSEQREYGRAQCSGHLLGTITPVVGAGGQRSFEVANRP